jgi:hypothetical protein
MNHKVFPSQLSVRFQELTKPRNHIRQWQRKKSRIVRTRILTKTPEKNAIEEE